MLVQLSISSKTSPAEYETEIMAKSWNIGILKEGQELTNA